MAVLCHPGESPVSVDCIHAKVMLLTNFVKTQQCAKVIHHYACTYTIDREQKSGLVSLRQFTVHQWVPHTTECEVCALFQKQEKGGRMKKVKGARGRRKPHIQEIAGTGYVAAMPLLLE